MSRTGAEGEGGEQEEGGGEVPLRANECLLGRLGETIKQNTKFSVQILSIEIQPYTSCFKD